METPIRRTHYVLRSLERRLVSVAFYTLMVDDEWSCLDDDDDDLDGLNCAGAKRFFVVLASCGYMFICNSKEHSLFFLCCFCWIMFRIR